MQTFSGKVGTSPVAGSGNNPEARPARRKRQIVQGAEPTADFVEALARGLRVLRCFEPGVKSLGNMELAQLTGLPKSTISRIVYTLAQEGYLRYHAETGRYSPGYGVLALGFGLLASLEVRQLARPLMEELAHETGGAVALGAFDGHAMTYVDAIHGSSALYLRLPVGHRLGPDSAMGRAYLAAVTPAERVALLAGPGGDMVTPAMLERACADLEAAGCCFAIGDWQEGINAVAAPFTTITGEGYFVMSCGGPASVLPEKRLRTEVADKLRQIVGKLSPR
ncbi:IclR family transcriptional regulator [Pollutimonas nitritireducens]|uniref:IclR family transcriptional regulator n=1 Tax=Pollutimonas nitritireducens TaxID=2045209 RepID=A0A2N4UED6_9BURK|nr:IclR family transcriptional regulator [Pollutimonas nitritireducens]PLC53381.1 IclR family transcriptional regulator [Pollutimonas nitritireducens]